MVRIIKNILFNSASPAILLLCISLFIYQPIFIYYNNKAHFYFPLQTALFYLAQLFFISYLILSIFTQIKNVKWQRIYTALLTGIALAMWIQTFFKGYSGDLNGASFQITNSKVVLIFNSMTFLGSAIFGIILSYRSQKSLQFGLLLISLFSLVYAGWMYLNLNTKTDIFTNPESQLVSFSKEKNVLFIILDGFQSDLFADILKNHPDLEKSLTGFVYFPNTIGVAPTTFLALPSIHSSSVYDGKQSIKQFHEDTIINNSFITALALNGYNSMLMNPIANQCPHDVHCGLENTLYFSNKPKIPFALSLVVFSFFKSVPHILKPLLYKNDEWISIGQENAIWQIISNNIFDVISTKINTSSVKPTIKFLHTFGTHQAFILNEHCQISNGRHNTNRDHAIQQDQCALSKILEVLNALKKNHIYNQTLVMIVADHGNGLWSTKNHLLGTAANPLFLYKPFFAENRTLQISNKYISIIDIPITICTATGDCGLKKFSGVPVFETVNSNRTFYFNDYEHKVINRNQIFAVNRYAIHGQFQNPNSWSKVYNSLPYKISYQIKDSSFLAYSGVGWDRSGWNGGPVTGWTVDRMSDLYIPLKPNKNAIIQLQVSTHEKNEHQEMTVFANSHFIGKFPIYKEIQKIQLKIPADIIKQDPTHILFNFSQNNPMSKDLEPLAVLFTGNIEIL